jgi:uncharacterized membrane protein
MRRLGKLLKNELVTGLVLMAPLGGTLYLVYALVSGVDGLFPDALRPEIFGHPLPGLGILAVLVLALGLGVFAHNFAGKQLVSFFDKALQKVPLFGSTYGLMRQVFESVFAQGADSFNRAVLIEYPRPGVYTIAFVTSSHVPIQSRDGKELVSVFVPTTPNPTSGFYLLVDKALVRDLEITVQQAFKLVITMGVANEPELVTTTSKLSRKKLVMPG